MREHGISLRGVFDPTKKQIASAIKRARLGDWTQPFVITDESSDLFMEDGAVQSRFVLSPSQDDEYGIIPGDIAREIREACDMEPSHHNKMGRVWELPGKPFFEAYRGYWETLRFVDILETIFYQHQAPEGTYDSGVWAEETPHNTLTIHCPGPLACFLASPVWVVKKQSMLWNAYVANRHLIFEPYEIPDQKVKRRKR
jgi:hypothetical protein